MWSVAIWSPSPRRVVGPWGLIYHIHIGWDCLTKLLVMESGRPVIRCLKTSWTRWLSWLSSTSHLSFWRVGPAECLLGREAQSNHRIMQPMLQAASLCRHRTAILAYTASNRHSSDIAGIYGDCRSDVWSGSSPGTWAAAPETKTGHVIRPSCFVDSKRATIHASRNKVVLWQMRRRKMSTPATDWQVR